MAGRILIVEDDAIVAAHLQRVVHLMGYEISGLLATGEEAVAQCATLRPDVVLMDIRLRGEMTGVQAAEQIGRQLEIPVIYLTAYADETVLQQAKVTQPYGYLTKPVRDKELRASIEMALFKGATDRKVKHLHQVLRAIRSVNQLLTRERDGQRLLEEACRILIQTRGYLLVWIGTAEPAANRVRPRAYAGLNDGYLDQMVISLDQEPTGLGPTTLAIRADQPVVCRDIATDPAFAPWRDLSLAQGFRSTAAIPMKRGPRLFGVLNVYADHGDIFDRDELSLLAELADDLAYGLQSMEEEAGRQQAEQALRKAHGDLERRVEERTTELASAYADLRRLVAAREFAENALAERQAQLLAILDNIPDLAWLKDRHFVFLAVNQAVAEAHGLPVEEIIGKTDFDLSPRELAEAYRAADEEVIRTGERKRIVEQHSSASGTPIWIETIKTPVRNANGDIIGTAGIARDISELKHAEERILQLLDKERQLSELKTRFISTASHEFRTPMTVAAGFAEMLRNQYDRLTEEKRRALLDRILESIWRVTGMLEDVLAINRVDQGKLTFSPARLDLAGLVSDVVEEIKLTDKAEHSFAVDAAPVPPEACADENLLRQILNNLLTNAIRYSPPASSIHVRLRCEDQLATLEIEDHGIGIPPEDQPRIFDPFERGRNVGRTRGSGLGLHIVKRLVELHRGKITFVSQLGSGSTFTVQIPIDSPPPPPPQA